MSILTTNRKARFEYSIEREIEAGIVLQGSEVKSILLGKAVILNSFIYITKDNEVFVKGINIPPYKDSSYLNHDENRDKKLLLHKKEISDIKSLLRNKGVTGIPLQIHASKGGKIKVLIGIARGKKLKDKRETIKKREVERKLKRGENI